MSLYLLKLLCSILDPESRAWAGACSSLAQPSPPSPQGHRRHHCTHPAGVKGGTCPRQPTPAHHRNFPHPKVGPLGVKELRWEAGAALPLAPSYHSLTRALEQQN